VIDCVDPSLRPFAQRLAGCVAELSHQFKLASMRCGEGIVARQCVQARLADAAMWVHGWACVLSKASRESRGGEESSSIREAASGEVGKEGLPIREAASGGRLAAEHFMRMAEEEIGECFRRLHQNTDASMHVAAKAAMKFVDTLPNSDYVIHEASPNAAGTGKVPARVGIRTFPGENADGRFPSPGTPGEGKGEGFDAHLKVAQLSDRPSPQPSPGVPGEGEDGEAF
jgi:acyl-CoA dehydrogenase family member 9